jgi:hypothetical protein
MLRSYDPQIGRFLQNDPYDQFASGYVGMGNDPGNNVDPTGGFSGPGVGCAATAGMCGFGGMVSGGSSLFGFISNGVGTGLSLLNNAISIFTTANGIGERQKIKPSPKSTEWTERILKEIFKKGPSAAGKMASRVLTSLIEPSDANSNIDDTFQGLLDRRIKRDEDSEENEIQKIKEEQVRYVTYYMIKFENGETVVYSGRTSGPASESAEEILRTRESQHKQDPRKKGYGAAEIDQEAVGGKNRLDPARMAIRGREQQLIDKNGRSRSEPGGRSGNEIRGVSKRNHLGYLYHQTSNVWFKQELYNFTGFFKY